MDVIIQTHIVFTFKIIFFLYNAHCFFTINICIVVCFIVSICFL